MQQLQTTKTKQKLPCEECRKIEPTRIGSDRIGSDRIGSDRIGSDRIGSDRVGSDRIGSRAGFAAAVTHVE